MVAAVCVVLHDKEDATRPKARGKTPDHGNLLGTRHEMEAVGRDEAVEQRQPGQVVAKVCDERRHLRGRKCGRERAPFASSDAAIAIDCHDLRAGTEQVGKGQRERAGPGSKVGPYGTGSSYRNCGS